MPRALPILAVAFAVPIIVLMAIAGYRQHGLPAGTTSAGTTLMLPIVGYNPRDLLSGYSLSYQVDYGVDEEELCPGDNARKGYICMDTRTFSYAKPDACKLFIRGKCDYRSRFRAGIERYYLPEQDALALDGMLRGTERHDFSIEVSVTQRGRASVEALLLDGFPWDEE